MIKMENKKFDTIVLMKYRRMPIEIESPEQMGYENIKCNLAESSVSDARLGDFSFDLNNLVLAYGIM